MWGKPLFQKGEKGKFREEESEEKMKKKTNGCTIGLHRISGLFISGIRPEIRFRLPDIWREKTVLN